MPRWIVWTLLTLLSWGVWAILSRLIERDLSALHSQALSTLGVLPVVVALWLMPDEPTAAEKVRHGAMLALLAGWMSCLGNIAFFAATGYTQAATVIPLTALYPVVTVLLAIPIFKEALNGWQWLGVVVSLGAIMLFNPPQDLAAGAWRSPTLLLPLASIGLWGVTGLLQKGATNVISARRTSLWFLASFIPVSIVILAMRPVEFGSLNARTWAIAIALGFTLALGNFTILRAFATGGKAAIIAPLAGLYPVVSIPIAIAYFGERPGAMQAWGIVLALVAVVLLAIQSEPATLVRRASEPVER
jgi:drug/metabolite transporter (DMT)-like permease